MNVSITGTHTYEAGFSAVSDSEKAAGEKRTGLEKLAARMPNVRKA
ncbi:MAG: hypothetical protein J6B06_01665 [Lachnospiraceae bacterium]|nr:hypothetical protein [Lachnospiraceae bacterium]